MTVAFIADTHDRTAVARRMARVCRHHDVDELVHLGDVCQPETLGEFGEFDVHWITGNGDQPHKEALNKVADLMDVSAHQWYAELEFGDVTFYCRHGMEHDLSYLIAAKKSSIDYVMHGHWHHQERSPVGSAEVLNPGDDGVYLYEPVHDEFEWIPVEVSDE